MKKSLLGADYPIEMDARLKDLAQLEIKPWHLLSEPFYHDLYNDLFYKDIIFENKKNGYFVEVGAVDGVRMSQSYIFESILEWDGIVVEPNPVWKDTLKLQRKCNISTEAISNVNGKEIFESREVPVFSGLKSSVNSSRQSDIIAEFDVDTITLYDLFDKFNAPDVIDWVSIDTEGAEIDILKQFFLENNKYKINLLNFETLDLTSSDKLMSNQPYLKIKNPYLDFLKISNQGLLKFNPFTGQLYKSPFNEWKYEGSFIDTSIKTPDFEQYYIHIDYLKNNLHLKKILIN
jgi:FkbM family methyltransferase